MQTKAKSNSIITHRLTPEGVTFIVAGAGELVLAFDAVSQTNRTRAMVHGFIQRVADAGAKSRNPLTGQPATPAEKLASMARLVDHYVSGSSEWSPARAEGAIGLDSILLAAVVEATGKTTEAVRAMVAAGAQAKGITPKAWLSAVGESKLVAPIVARIRGEQVADLDGDALLDEAFGNSEGEPTEE